MEPHPRYVDCVSGYFRHLAQLARIREECEAELARIEQGGGCAGFAERILALACGEEVDGRPGPAVDAG